MLFDEMPLVCVRGEAIANAQPVALRLNYLEKKSEPARRAELFLEDPFMKATSSGLLTRNFN